MIEKIHKSYVCQICGAESNDKEEIIRCENQIRPQPLPDLTIFRLTYVLNDVLYCVKSSRVNSFDHSYTSNIATVGPFGAIWGPHEVDTTDRSKIADVDTDSEKFKRMLKLLEENGIDLNKVKYYCQGRYCSLPGM